ncbi:hypothetical protein BKA63DRAFT_121656 [Paraphoma chrysanthemicola]|nr:hypothetical protein BKA63DRAFT_121656 [Paraphoma chrysanthemicola]
MTPNLFLATQKVFQPHKWFRGPKSTERATRVTEFWNDPEPGQYEYIPGRGWFKISELKTNPSQVTESLAPYSDTQPYSLSNPHTFTKLAKPIPVHRSRVLGRYLLEDDYKKRKVTTTIKNEQGKLVTAGFFQLDDGVAWVQCWDANGTFIPGGPSGYKLWCVDSATREFRHMRKGDDPKFVRSRNNSHERDLDSRSQDSMSTAFRSGPGSTRDGPSAPSTRANSIRGPFSNPASTPSSRAQSRRNSPRRNNSIPLEEAKAALRRMAKEQEEAVIAAAAQTRTISKDNVHRIERGRTMTRIVS